MGLYATRSVFFRYMTQFSRNKIAVVVLFIFPFFFLFIFHLAFGGTSTSSTTYQISIINNDNGIPKQLQTNLMPQGWLGEGGAGANLSKTIFTLNYDNPDSNETIPIFASHSIQQANINESIHNGDISLAVIIPENFSLTMLNIMYTYYGGGYWPAGLPHLNASIQFEGDQNSMDYTIAKSIVQSVVTYYTNAIKSGVVPQNISTNMTSVLPEKESSVFDFIAAGIFVYGSIISAAGLAAMLVAEEETKTITRIKMAKIGSFEYLMGYFAFCFVISIFQFLFLILGAMLIFGFSPAGSLPAAYVVLLITNFASIGLIFTVAAMFSNAETVGSGLGFASSILGFASNAFFEMPNIVLIPGILSFTSGSPDLLLWDLFPWTHAVNAIRAILLFDQSIADVAGDVILLTVFGVVWCILGAWWYAKKKLVGGTEE